MADPQILHAELERYAAGDDGAGDAICASLQPLLARVARRRLGDDDPDAADVVQDALIAFLGYLRRTRIVPTNPEAFVTAIVQNRCTNLAVWRRRRRADDVHDVADRLPDPGSTPLEILGREESDRWVRDALGALDAPCAALLEEVYARERSMQELKTRLGLKSVQAVYYRRDACLRKLQKILNRALLEGRGIESETGRLSSKRPSERNGHGG